MLGRSRIPYPCRWRVDVIRRVPIRVGGRIVDDCEPLYMYRNVPANIATSLARQENTLGKDTDAGMNSSKEYLVGLGGLRIPSNIIQGDLVRIYWGTPPNLSAIPQVPQGYGDVLILQVGNDLVYLNWTNSPRGWSGGGYSLVYNTAWELFSGSEKLTEFSDDSDNPRLACESFPTGISLHKISGNPLDFQIRSVDHKYDDAGMWHHTTLITDYADIDGRKRL